ncbi:hypothetical protein YASMINEVIRUS_876 [Yasminevirus sp. GU-2018]|uniref:Uncharacterized protein n=1 Tax=Yasminevirus sp. GU-2018 TaxID=2420051 RepID=A0A5K0UAD9_9VIRU|nr:hypothetical protein YASMINEVIRUS_876 [Yasminevirus sp. GU-2018]
MNGVKISVEDIFGSSNININTPVIILRNVSREYLIPITNVVAELNTERLHRDLGHRIQFIDRFVPIGQISTINPLAYKKSSAPKKREYVVPMANIRIVHTTNTFEEVRDDVWIGVVRKNDKESRTLGTIASRGSPKTEYPVFPSTFLKRDTSQPEDADVESEMYRDVYSDDVYGRWTLNLYKFNVDKTHLKMIDSTGGISSMYIPKPVVPSDVVDVGYGDDNYKRKVYFTAQGAIVSDSNCVPPRDNMNKMTLNECNATASRVNGVPYSVNLEGIYANDDDQLALNLNESAEFMTNEPKRRRSRGSQNQQVSQDVKMSSAPYTSALSKTFKRGRKLVLREKDEPWFTDSDVVGSVASVTDPHKVTGIVDGTPIGTIIGILDGDEDETEAPYSSPCVGNEPSTGYSRLQKAEKCSGKRTKNRNENFEGESDSDASYMEHVNNVIMYVMCVIILLLLVYKFTDRK